MLLRRGLAHSTYRGRLAAALAPRHRVLPVGSHGRSTRGARPLGYDLMADVVGWSDGGVIDLALRHPGRIGKVAAFAANADSSGVFDGMELDPTFATFIARSRQEYERPRAAPRGFDALLAAVGGMWAKLPQQTDADLARIAAPIGIADGDEAVRRSHTSRRKC